MAETKARSISKAISWRVLATMTTATLVYVTTGELTLAFTVGAMEVVAKFLLYYVHERAWQKISFGTKA